MSTLAEHFAREDARREADAERYAAHDPDLCMLCGAYGADKRSLFVNCGYAVHEFVPEAILLRGLADPEMRRRGYYLNLCKSCRGRLLEKLAEWRAECIGLRGMAMDHDGYLEYPGEDGRTIPVRRAGRIVMLTPEEFAAEKQADANV